MTPPLVISRSSYNPRSGGPRALNQQYGGLFEFRAYPWTLKGEEFAAHMACWTEGRCFRSLFASVFRPVWFL